MSNKYTLILILGAVVIAFIVFRSKITSTFSQIKNNVTTQPTASPTTGNIPAGPNNPNTQSANTPIRTDSSAIQVQDRSPTAVNATDSASSAFNGFFNNFLQLTPRPAKWNDIDAQLTVTGKMLAIDAIAHLTNETSDKISCYVTLEVLGSDGTVENINAQSVVFEPRQSQDLEFLPATSKGQKTVRMIIESDKVNPQPVANKIEIPVIVNG